MKTYENLWYIDKLFLEWEIFRTSCRENKNEHFVFSNFFFSFPRGFLWVWNLVADIEGGTQAEGVWE